MTKLLDAIIRWFEVAKHRKWLYRVLLAGLSLLLLYGIVDEKQSYLWAALLGNLLGFGVAHANVNDEGQ